MLGLAFIAAKNEAGFPQDNQCQFGTDGYLVRLKDVVQSSSQQSYSRLAVPPAQQFAEKLRTRWEGRRSSQEKGESNRQVNEILHVYSELVFNGLAARLDAQELQAVHESDDVKEVLPNCLVKLPTNELLNAGSKDSSSLVDVAAVGNAFQSNPPSWGLDRIDARSGLDQRYDYGTATGNETIVYVLDTGTCCLMCARW